MTAKFYVYEHWRPDTGKCFYVGKGHGGRANNMHQRNRYHKAIQKKLSALGLSIEVKIYAGGLEESEAFNTEIARIAFWRSQGAALANLADGGGINSGWSHSEERRRAIGESKRGNSYRLGAKLSVETKAKIAIAHTGKKLSADHLKKMSNAATGEKNPFFGKTHSKEVGRRVADANRRRVWSEESKRKLAASLTGRKHPPRTRTWTHSEEVKQRMSVAAKLRWEKRREANESH